MQTKRHRFAGAATNRDVDKPPIFVVGVPRSGTTLLAAMLAGHSRLSCGTETRFFRFLAEIDPAELCDQFSWPDNAVEFLFSIKLVDIPVPQHYGLAREQIHSYLRSRRPEVSVVLSSLTEQFMRRQGKRRWVEKSPEHLRYVDSIRKYFPQSPIIRILRDPRDVALSLVKTPWGPSAFLDALMLWRRYDDQSARFFQRDENCYTIRYENLLQSPEAELKKLCAFIDEEYEHGMLDTSSSATNVVTQKDAWHRIVHKSVDITRIQVWKRDLTKEQNRVAEALVGDRLLAYEYECDEVFDRTASVYPSPYLLLKHRASLESFVDQGVRFWRTDHNDKIQCSIYVGEPTADKWLRHEKPARWLDTSKIVARILIGKVAHQHIFWVQDRVASSESAYCSRLIASVFQHTGASYVAMDCG